MGWGGVGEVFSGTVEWVCFQVVFWVSLDFGWFRVPLECLRMLLEETPGRGRWADAGWLSPASATLLDPSKPKINRFASVSRRVSPKMVGSVTCLDEKGS